MDEKETAPQENLGEPILTGSPPDRAQKSFRVVQPIFSLHRKPKVNEGIFARLDDYLRAEIVDLSKETSKKKLLLRGFFKWALYNLDADTYEAIQNKYIEIGRGTEGKDCKFLNFVHYSKSKVSQAYRLGLHKCTRKRILDLGCGPGHFQVIAKYFGHEVFGLDLPLQADHLYNALCAFFEVSKIDHRIEAMQPLPAFPQTFDMVTVFLTQFDLDKEGRPWNEQSWRFFVDDVCNNLLNPNGVLYLGLTSNRRPKEVWEYLQSISEWDRRVMLIRRPELVSPRQD